jgi:pSer/pThr/pTyr-binding forkhead associated (FHA) protein
VPFIEFRQQLYPLRLGENLIGSSAQANIRLPDLPDDCELAISLEGESALAWASGEGPRVSINGQRLTTEPVSLFSGDEISVEDSSLLFPLIYVDNGSEAALAPRSSKPHRAPAAVADGIVESQAGTSNVESDLMTRVTPPVAERKVVGVLRRFDNNRAYIVDGSGFRIGREKHCDLIIPDKSVSRLHAEIAVQGNDYVLQDAGRIPTKVNGKEIGGPYTLKVGDVIQIGDHEFAFIRRPATAEEIVGKGEVTPVRSAVPDAPTVMPGKVKKGGSRMFNYVLLALLLALLGLIVLG